MLPKELAKQLGAVAVALIFAMLAFVGTDYILVAYGGPYFSPFPTITAFANFLLVYKSITGSDFKTSARAFATTVGWWTFVLAWLILAAAVAAAIRFWRPGT
jgi:hypothetical protein